MVRRARGPRVALLAVIVLALAAPFALSSAAAAAQEKTIDPGYWDVTNKVQAVITKTTRETRCIKPAEVAKFSNRDFDAMKRLRARLHRLDARALGEGHPQRLPGIEPQPQRVALRTASGDHFAVVEHAPRAAFDQREPWREPVRFGDRRFGADFEAVAAQQFQRARAGLRAIERLHRFGEGVQAVQQLHRRRAGGEFAPQQHREGGGAGQHQHDHQRQLREHAAGRAIHASSPGGT